MYLASPRIVCTNIDSHSIAYMYSRCALVAASTNTSLRHLFFFFLFFPGTEYFFVA